MPKQIAAEELEAITAVIRAHPNGAGVKEICNGLTFELPTRTLQRRLKRLEESRQITTTGSGKGKRYFPTVIAPLPETKAMSQSYPTPRTTVDYRDTATYPSRARVGEPESSKETIPLSEAAKEIRESVQSPLSARTPVGYDRTFLELYVPNKTMYLPFEIREELAQIGQVGVSGLPAGTYARQVLDRLLIDLSWNSSRLEGNTYSLLETERLLKKGESAGERNAEETQMILNHKAAIEMLAEQAEEIGFNHYTVCNLHALLSDNLLTDPSACGRVRSRPVRISGTVYHPLEVPTQIEEHFSEILLKAEAIQDPFEQAFFVMVQLPYLQPFEDVNKRVSRLSANIPMVKFNLCPLSFIDMPQRDYVSGLIGVYELNRIEYLRDVFVWAYRRSAGRYSAVLQSLGDPDPFRLRYRIQIGESVRTVVTNEMDKARATRWVAKEATEKIPQPDQPRFAEVVETELLNLHEGNIARYRLRPGEFTTWFTNWK